jgi:hypothetical protein
MRLCDLTDPQLNAILQFSDKELQAYIHELITEFYPSVELNSEQYVQLRVAYVSSIYIEKQYRTDRVFQNGFRVIYTKTGLIRNIINDIYYAEDDLIIH